MTAPQKQLVKKVAFVLWRDESIRAAKRERTFEQWRDESEETRDRWHRSAKAALVACRAEEMLVMLRKAEEALSSSYDAQEHPADGTSTQEITASEIRALLAKLDEAV